MFLYLFFLGGVFVVLIGWPMVGMVLEIYGFFLLFRGFFPVAVGFIRRIPILGSLLNLPGISGFVDKVGESSNMV
uniref:Golgi transport 1Ba n=1 Tax=Scleropages formosus TaxID=113540 RepID=A0A8C9SX67_SCLFO